MSSIDFLKSFKNVSVRTSDDKICVISTAEENNISLYSSTGDDNVNTLSTNNILNRSETLNLLGIDKTDNNKVHNVLSVNNKLNNLGEINCFIHRNLNISENLNVNRKINSADMIIEESLVIPTIVNSNTLPQNIGSIFYNSTKNQYEGYTTSGWKPLGGIDQEQDVDIENNLSVKQNLYVIGDLTVSNILVNTELEVRGALLAEDGIEVNGMLLANTASINQGLEVTGGLIIKNGDLEIRDGILTINTGDLEVNESVTVGNDLEVHNNVIIENNLEVHNDVTIKSGVFIEGALSVGSTITGSNIISSNSIILPLHDDSNILPQQNGSIFYNSTKNQYEGFTAGVWKPLGGIDQEQDVIIENNLNVMKKIGIGTHPGEDYELDIVGNVNINGNTNINGVLFYDFSSAISDIRVKEDIQIHSNNIKELNYEKLKEINIYDFKYKFNERERVGVLAQELQKIFPKCIVQKDKHMYESNNGKIELDNALFVESDSLNFVLLDVIQVLQKKIESQEYKINIQEQQINLILNKLGLL